MITIVRIFSSLNVKRQTNNNRMKTKTCLKVMKSLQASHLYISFLYSLKYFWLKFTSFTNSVPLSRFLCIWRSNKKEQKGKNFSFWRGKTLILHIDDVISWTLKYFNVQRIRWWWESRMKSSVGRSQRWPVIYILLKHFCICIFYLVILHVLHYFCLPLAFHFPLSVMLF